MSNLKSVINERRVDDIFLHPGEYAVGDRSCRIRTLLGSCVAITLWHPKRKIGAMCHFLLPNRGFHVKSQPDGRYADEVVALMMRKLRQLQIDPHTCQAKIFGGGRMFALRRDSEPYDIGRKNGETARRLLTSMDIPIMSESLFGLGHRQIVFDIASGDVWSRQGTLQNDVELA